MGTRIVSIVQWVYGHFQSMRLKYEITLADHLELQKARMGSRRLTRLCLSVAGVLVGIWTYCYQDHGLGMAVVWGFTVFAILQFWLPSLNYRKFYNRNPRLFGTRTVDFDDEGVKSDGPLSSVNIQWANFEKFVETKNLFLTFQTRDVVGVIPKRAFESPEAIAEFRRFLSSKMKKEGKS